MPEQKKPMECPYCQETDPENLPTFHYPGIFDSTHIECQSCGQEFSRQEAEKTAETSQMIAQVLQRNILCRYRYIDGNWQIVGEEK